MRIRAFDRQQCTASPDRPFMMFTGPSGFPLLTRAASRLVNHVRLLGRPSHHRRIRSAKNSLITLRSIRGAKQLPNGDSITASQRAFGYLRKLHSAVFEEAILTSLETAGYFVLRNKAYTNDGGLDGQFWHPDIGWVAIQAKRYSAHITASHVRDFGDLLADKKFKAGIFVHSGRTGEGSREHARVSASSAAQGTGAIFGFGQRAGRPIVFVSGQGLVDLMRTGALPPMVTQRAATPARSAAPASTARPAPPKRSAPTPVRNSVPVPMRTQP